MFKGECLEMSDTVKVATSIRDVLFSFANAFANCGFIKRKRKVTGSNFLRSLLFAFMGNTSPSESGLARSAFAQELKISSQGLNRRFTKECAEFLKMILDKAMGEVVRSDKLLNFEVLSRFTNINICDSSLVGIPDALTNIWKGTGDKSNRDQAAAIKFDVSMEMKSGGIKMHLVQGVMADNTTPSAIEYGEVGSLQLRDLGYYDLDRMKMQNQMGVYWISRFKTGTNTFEVDGKFFDLLAYLKNLNKDGVHKIEKDVLVGNKQKIPCRILIFKLNEKEIQERIRKKYRKAAVNGTVPSAEAIELCSWSIFISNVPIEKLTLDECYAMYRVRWQIENIFKLWKDECKVDESKSKKKWRILCEIYVKLIGILIRHWIVVIGQWHLKNKSLTKGFQMIKEQSARFAEAIKSIDALIALLEEFIEGFKYGCSQNSRKKKPNTYKMLDNLKQ